MINQKTTIAIISVINHLDIDVLKHAIETNEQREVTLIKPNEIKIL